MRIIDAEKLKEEILKWLPSDPCGVEEKAMPYETDIVVSMMLTLEDAPTIKTTQIKYFDEEEKVWKTGEVIVDE
jgi:hypothetical protein